MKKYIPIIVGIGLPLLMILFVAGSIYLPNLFVKPQYNFLYAPNNSPVYSYPRNTVYKNYYAIESNKLVIKPSQIATSSTNNYPYGTQIVIENVPPLYLYDVNTDSVKAISFQDAQSLKLDSSPTSPDGFILDWQYQNDGIFDIFGSSASNRGMTLSKGSAHKKLNGVSNIGYYYDYSGLNFLGWVIK